MEDTIINSLVNYFSGLDWSKVTDALILIIPALLCITFHELCHGLVAYKLGDNTAKNAGRLTLNPIKHIDILGLIMIIIFKFGWAKPVPVNMNNFKNPKRGMAVTALAGPVSNIVLAAFVMLIYGFFYNALASGGTVATVIQQMLIATAYISCALAIFNVIPIPPLDGSKVLFSLLPEKAYYKLMRYEKYGFIVLLVLVWANVFTPFLTNGTQAVYDWLAGIAQWSYSLTV